MPQKAVFATTRLLSILHGSPWSVPDSLICLFCLFLPLPLPLELTFSIEALILASFSAYSTLALAPLTIQLLTILD